MRLLPSGDWLSVVLIVFPAAEKSNLSQEIKDNAKLQHHYNLTVIAVGKNEVTTAKAEAEEYRKGAEASNNVVQTRLAHELAGIIALAEKDYDHAIVELQQANQQNPRNLFRLSQAYAGKGDDAKAKEFASKASSFNSLPQLNYAFIRTRALRMCPPVRPLGTSDVVGNFNRRL